MKPNPLVSEVRPLIEENQTKTQDGKISWDPEPNQTEDLTSLHQNPSQTLTKRDNDQAQPLNASILHQHTTDQPQSQSQEEDASQKHSPLKKKTQTTMESKIIFGPTAQAAASHMNSTGRLRKAQSVQSLLSDSGKMTRWQHGQSPHCQNGTDDAFTLCSLSVKYDFIQWSFGGLNLFYGFQK